MSDVVTFPHDEFLKMFAEIQQKEPEAANVLYEVVKHIHGTYNDKYQSDAAKIVDTKHMLTKTDGGKFANVHSALKYIQRYISEGFPKSYQLIDLLKAIHYIVFEIQRRRTLAPSQPEDPTSSKI